MAVPLPSFRAKGSELRPGQYLDQGEALVTPNGGVVLMQSDGNLVLYAPDGKGQYTPLWWTGTSFGVRATVLDDGNLVVINSSGNALYNSRASGRAAVIRFQDDGNLVWYDANGRAVQSSMTNGWQVNPNLAPKHESFLKKLEHAAGSVVSTVTKPFMSAEHAVEKIPVAGNIVKVTREIATAPVVATVNAASAIASGARIDHAALGALKTEIGAIKDVAPYATTVVSMVPGIGTGVAAAVSAGAALVEGQSITEAAKAAIRGALPGGALATSAFDTATKIASGENVTQAALETARAALPSPEAQKAFDVGVAVATGEKLQTVVAKGLSAIGSDQAQAILSAGKQALASTPGLADALKGVTPGAAQEGFTLAAGLLGHSGVNEKALTTVRAQLPPDMQQGFDAALQTQAPHTAWVANVIKAVPTPAAPAMHAPTVLEPPKRAAAAAPATRAPTVLEPPKRVKAVVYGPYPKTTGVSGPPPACRRWGDPVQLTPDMVWAGRSAVNGSDGRPRVIQGPDGRDYLFAIENGELTARLCVA